MTILIVHNCYQIPGGEDTVIENEKKMLEDYGHKVILYTRNNAELNGMKLSKKWMVPLMSLFNIRTYREVKRVIKNRHIDLVHVHNTAHLISPAVYYAAVVCRIPIVQTIHNFRFLCPAAVLYRNGRICRDCVPDHLFCAVRHKCYRNSRLQTILCVLNLKLHRKTGIYRNITYICLTDFNREVFLNVPGIRPSQVFVKPNFAEDKASLVPPEKRKEQFIYAGRLEKLKGVDVMLRAWRQMREKAPRLVICGTGTLEERCRTYVADHRLNVEMKGFVPNEEVCRMVAESKALILPTQWYEGFPMSMIEAYSVGTPVIGSDLGNVGSIAVEGITGCKFTCNSEKSLIEAIERLGQYKDIYASTLTEYRRSYGRDSNYRILMEIYKKSYGVIADGKGLFGNHL